MVHTMSAKNIISILSGRRAQPEEPPVQPTPFMVITPQPWNTTTVEERYGKTVTLHNNAVVNTVAFDNNVIELDGVLDFVSVGEAGDFSFLHNGTTAWTFELIFYMRALGQDYLFSTTRDLQTTPGINFYLQNTGGWAQLEILNADMSFQNHGCYLEQINHIALTYNPLEVGGDGTIAFFSNGYLRHTVTATASPTGSCNQLYLGTRYGDELGYLGLNGYIMGARITKAILYEAIPLDVNPNIQLTSFPVPPET